MIKYTNPILPGFYPDPSICQDGDNYYLVTSSFEFFPGVPLFHSKDLIHWIQIGHVLTRKSQIDLTKCKVSAGIWAPTIRKHNNRFYVSTTNFGNGGNFYVWTDNIYSEWSDPIWVDQGGIDPSLFFDDDGSVYITSTYDLPESQGIGQSKIDIDTGKRLTETINIWNGSGGKYTEAPHMFKYGEYYYLMTAEGGTEYGHMITIARANNPWGPFENYENNPILTHRDTKLHQFQAIGHGDIAQDLFGKWWIVFHGIRTTQYMLHHLGRETMIAPFEWNKQGWPVVNNKEMILPEMIVDRQVPAFEKSEKINRLSKVNFIRNPNVEDYDLTKYPDKVRLKGTDKTLNDCDSPSFFGIRQQNFNCKFTSQIVIESCENNAITGITVFHTNEHHYDLFISKENGIYYGALRKHVGDIEIIEGKIPIPHSSVIQLMIKADKLNYEFFIGNEGNFVLIGKGRSQLLSTECMPMTFTGCYLGCFAEGKVSAEFQNIQYTE